jgi:thiol-disulfide isomerase/thioredoxin
MKVLIVLATLLFIKTDPAPLIKMDFEDFKSRIEAPSENLRIYNFWATWCAPCIKEMPYFESVVKSNKQSSLVFVSLDDDRRPERVVSFIEKKGINSPVWLLSEKEQKDWKQKLDEDWSGVIPATLFVAADGRSYFHKGQISEEQLKALIETYL